MKYNVWCKGLLIVEAVDGATAWKEIQMHSGTSMDYAMKHLGYRIEGVTD